VQGVNQALQELEGENTDGEVRSAPAERELFTCMALL